MDSFISSSKHQSKNKMKYLNNFCTENCVKDIANGKLQCNCGELDINNWSWCKDDLVSNIYLTNNNKEILFHPIYSSGTAALRGDTPFQQNLHYYWEIKMISTVYGTDVMVGVGTSEIVLQDWKYKFCSLLGIDSHSWGYSFHGKIQHNKMSRKYGSTYGLGSLVGVHLDMCQGTLEYYVNRKPMGIAFENLKDQKLYPMISSTAAQSAVRTTCSLSLESSLQLKCLQTLAKHPEHYKKYRQIPGLTRIYDRLYFWITPVEEKREDKAKADLYNYAIKKCNNSYLKLDITHSDLDTSKEETAPDKVSSEASSKSLHSDLHENPSTSGENDELRKKIKISDSFECSLYCGIDNKACKNCKLRSRMEEESSSDDSGCDNYII